MATEYRLFGFGRRGYPQRARDGTLMPQPIVVRIAVGKNAKLVEVELTPDDVRKYLKELVSLL